MLAVAFIMAADTILCDLPDIATDRRAGVRGITPRFGLRAGAGAAVTFSCLGALSEGSVGRWGLAVTAVGLTILAVLLARNPDNNRLRLLADGLIIFLPGPLALLFR